MDESPYPGLIQAGSTRVLGGADEALPGRSRRLVQLPGSWSDRPRGGNVARKSIRETDWAERAGASEPNESTLLAHESVHVAG